MEIDTITDPYYFCSNDRVRNPNFYKMMKMFKIVPLLKFIVFCTIALIGIWIIMNHSNTNVNNNFQIVQMASFQPKKESNDLKADEITLTHEVKKLEDTKNIKKSIEIIPTPKIEPNEKEITSLPPTNELTAGIKETHSNISNERITKVSTYQQTGEIMKKRTNVLNERRAELCQKGKLGTSSRLFLSDDLHMAFCLSNKGGSTSFLMFLQKVYEESHHIQLNIKSEDIRNSQNLAKMKLSREHLNTYHNVKKSIILSRNPLTRLISGYYDKIEDKKLSRVCERFFENSKVCPIESKEPCTFPDFIDILVNHIKLKGKLNIHFKPQVDTCSACNHKYTHHLKLETIGKDLEYLQYMKLFPKVDFPWFINSAVDGKVLSSFNTDDRIKKELKKLNKEQYDQIIDLYKNDFYIFDYKIIPFEDM